MHRTARKRQALVRRLIQAFFFLMMPGAFVAGFSGIKHIFQSIAKQDVLTWNGFVAALVGLCAFTILFGRFFCGFACAFGTLGDLVYWLSGLIQTKLLRRRKRLRIPVRFVPYAQKVKYILLAAIVICCAVNVYDAMSRWNWNPWQVFSYFVALRFDVGAYRIGIMILVLIVVGMAVQERFFCQVLCPMGAVFALLPQLPFTSLQRDPAQCIPGCNACRNNCPVDLKLEQDGIRNGECIACEMCVSICPKQNLTRPARRLLRGALLPVLLKAGLLFGLGAYLGLCRFL